ncbi:MAG: hypothetical protein GY910_27985 [bacterium]|nr:hypothetical protein [Deltaproteobacteria bacterium]MCP4908835.1 hypothetical protein [bacterium]
MSEAITPLPIETPIDRDLVFRVEQFYYREARILDERKFQQWLGLVTEDIRYTIPARHVPLNDSSMRGTEALHDEDREISRCDVDELPFREEDLLTLAVRVDRNFKINAWAETPAARTRRFITNIEVWAADTEGEFRAYSNFMLSFSRHGTENYTYTGQRRDRLRVDGDAFKIAEREVILEENVITTPTLGLFF